MAQKPKGSYKDRSKHCRLGVHPVCVSTRWMCVWGGWGWEGESD
jgi:hypothetical protein